eukprot:5481444-Amphidinium_carterae.1
MESLPQDVTAQQMVAPNGQLIISLLNPMNPTLATTPQPEPRWDQPSRVTSRCKCAICGLEDKVDRPLSTCWHEDRAGKKCGKRFCFNQHKQCGSRVAFSIKPPAPSGLKDFPDCVWCKQHDGILIPVDKFKLKVGTRED